jgi:hypothetical protein
VDAKDRRRLIETYREGPAVLEAAIAEVPESELDRSADGWTPRQIAHHVADSEMTAAIRLRRLLAEDRPLINGYDEAEYARRLHYGERPIEDSLLAVRGARASTAALLDRLSDEEWAREGTHSESGRYTVTGWLEIYAAHCHDHADQVRRSRRP